MHLNGKLTAGENIADIGGVKLGYQAYLQWRSEQSPPPPSDIEGFTDDQLYFLGYAQSWCSKMTPEAAEMRAHTDPHSPAKWRVNGVIVDQPGCLYVLSRDRNALLEAEHPQIASALHKFMIGIVTERLRLTTETLQAVLT